MCRWDADLGVPLAVQSTLYVMLGDVLGSAPHPRLPSAIGVVNRTSTFTVQHVAGPILHAFTLGSWREDAGGLPEPVFPLLGASTVPSGAIALNNSALMLFLMCVQDWRNGVPGTCAALVTSHQAALQAT